MGARLRRDRRRRWSGRIETKQGRGEVDAQSGLDPRKMGPPRGQESGQGRRRMSSRGAGLRDPKATEIASRGRCHHQVPHACPAMVSEWALHPFTRCQDGTWSLEAHNSPDPMPLPTAFAPPAVAWLPDQARAKDGRGFLPDEHPSIGRHREDGLRTAHGSGGAEHQPPGSAALSKRMGDKKQGGIDPRGRQRVQKGEGETTPG